MSTESLPPYRSLRMAAGLSQREVERRCGWKRGHLSWIERGAQPTEAQRTRLLAVLMEALGRTLP